MMDEVVDASVFVAALVREDESHNEAIKLIEDMVAGHCLFHTSMLVPIEVCEAIFRGTASLVRAYVAGRALDDFIREGKIKPYDLNKGRMDAASEIVIQRKLRGADAVAIQLAEELELPLRSFNPDVVRGFQGTQEP